MLGLFNPNSKKDGQSGEEEYHSDDGEGPETGDPVVDNKTKAGWMKPLILIAHEPSTLLPSIGISPKSNLDASYGDFQNSGGESPSFVTPNQLVFSSENCQADVPAWIEMMNRTERVRQLTYVVRVIQRKPAIEAGKNVEDPEMEGSATMEKDSGTDTFVRLRTGRELAQIMRVGQGHVLLRPSSSENNSTQHSRNSFMRNNFAGERTAAPLKRDSRLSLSPQFKQSQSAEIPRTLSFNELGREEESEEESIVSHDQASVDEWEDAGATDDERDPESEPETDMESEPEPEPEPERERAGKKGAVQKGKSLIGNLAKTAKSATVATGKLTSKAVVGTGKLTSKAMVGTGKLTAKTVVGTGKLTAKTVVGTGKLTKKVASGTSKVAVGTGMAAVRQSRKVAKGTVNVGKSLTVSAGKAVIGPISRKSKKPPKRPEPKVKHKEKEKKNDRQVEVSKTM
jgi:hypothetical protein